MKKIFTGRFTDTELTIAIGKKVCEHIFVLSADKYPWIIRVRITSENELNPAVIEHFQRWKSCSLSQSEREELYYIFQLEGKTGKKVVEIRDIKIEIEMKKETKSNCKRSIMKNIEGLVAFYEMLAC